MSEIADLSKPEQFAVLVIDFEKNTLDPARVFRAGAAMIQALAEADRTLADGFGLKLDPEPLLLDIEAGSLRTKLATFLRNTPDEILEKGEVRPLIGNFLVRSKHRLLKALDPEATPDLRLRLEQTRDAIANEAKATGFAALGYTPPPVQVIAEHLRAVSRATAMLQDGDRMRYEAGADAAFLEPSTAIDDEKLDEALTDRELVSSARMLLKIKRPDFLGDTQWDFRHGQEQIRARIADEIWLQSFRSRLVAVRPGDALDAMVRVTARYGTSGDLLRTTHTVLQVINVVSSAGGASLPLGAPDA